MGHPDPDTSARVVWLSQPPTRLGYHLVPPERSLWSLREEMVPSLLSVFTFYIIAAIAPADAKLQPRAVRQYATPSRSFTGIEGKWRACGIIERAWIRYALDEMWDEGSHLTVTAQRAQDEGYDNMMPPYRFWVPSAAWSP